MTQETGSNMPAENLKVAHAKELLRRVGGKGCVVMLFDESGAFAVAEWGRDKSECSNLKKLVDAIADKLASGDLPAP